MKPFKTVAVILVAAPLCVIAWFMATGEPKEGTARAPSPGGNTDHAPWVSFDQWQVLKAENDKLRREFEFLKQCVSTAVDGAHAKACLEPSRFQDLESN